MERHKCDPKCKQIDSQGKRVSTEEIHVGVIQHIPQWSIIRIIGEHIPEPRVEPREISSHIAITIIDVLSKSRIE